MFEKQKSLPIFLNLCIFEVPVNQGRTRRQNYVVSTSMRRHHAALTLIGRHFDVCPLKNVSKLDSAQQTHDVEMTLMGSDAVALASVRRHFDVMCPLGDSVLSRACT